MNYLEHGCTFPSRRANADPDQNLYGLRSCSGGAPASRHLAESHPQVLIIARSNLLGKAILALKDDELERVDHLVGRAAQKGFDHREGRWPILWEAHMMLFGLVTDVLEDSASADHRWLDVTMSTMEEAQSAGRLELASILRTIDHDYHLTKRESARIQQVASPGEDDLGYLDPGLDREQLVIKTRAILDTCVDFVRRADMAGIAPI